ncbi:lytic murein transglycosylase [Afifella sp. H1R]|uniref:lytic murein transglycosylase n=1 Tax=Afifella sp. H1R TaxID=2908841 RepID=UPI001F1F6605|nr:lytic murein transglycosylase [Afifella sp. H1R]MCF1503480.1 lytic murein transglycosylase [Afifella sp. H1R]
MRAKCVWTAAVFGLVLATPAAAQQCGGDFSTWLNGVKQEAAAAGVSDRGLSALSGVQFDRRVISRDRAQGVFTQTFAEFAGRMVNDYRLKNGRSLLNKYASTFSRIEQKYGVPGPVISAFWALETDFGANQGDFDTLNALATLAHDCRRPELFRPQLIAALKLLDRGDLARSEMKGAWAGELGQTQILPSDYLASGVDFDGDGHVNLKKSVPDVLATAGNFLNRLGWRANEPWLQEVVIPADLPWAEAGLYNKIPVSKWESWGVKARSGNLPGGSLPASLVLPMGRNGPAFLAYPNFHVFLEWNQSLVYATTAAYLATRLDGAPRADMGNASSGLSSAQMKQLQQALLDKGYQVGKVDGILGAMTRDAVRSEQLRLGLPADAWPTEELLAKIR